MAIAAIPKELFNYVLKQDLSLPREQRTIFHLRALSSEEEAHVRDLYWHHGPGTSNYERVIRGLVGWTNFNDETGGPIPFKERELDGEKISANENLNYITQYIPELSRAIESRLRYKPEEEKEAEKQEAEADKKDQ